MPERTRRAHRVAWAATSVLVVVVLVFVVLRITEDASNLARGIVPPEGEFGRRYAQRPVLAHLHILPGVVYLLGAPVQLMRRVRDRHLGLHRRLGRYVVLPAGLLTGAFAIAVGLIMPYGGFAEASATLVFGTWFLAALVLAVRAIRIGDATTHRRWMIRAYAVGLGVGMIRIVVGLGGAAGIGIEASFGAAFWIAFVLMAALAEWWLRPSRRSLVPAASPDLERP